MTPDSIREARQSLGLTQSDMARLLGYGDKARISELEKGSRRPGESVVRLLRAYVSGYRPDDWMPLASHVGSPGTDSTSDSPS